jgi:hypothetical protein
MFLRTDEQTNRRTDAFKDRRTEGQMLLRTDEQTNRRTDVFKDRRTEV